jgi:hypothetical protein
MKMIQWIYNSEKFAPPIENINNNNKKHLLPSSANVVPSFPLPLGGMAAYVIVRWSPLTNIRARPPRVVGEKIRDWEQTLDY